MLPLLHTQAKIIQALLIAGGQGIDSGTAGDWRVFAHTESEKNDQAIFVYNTSSVLDGRAMETGEVSEHYGVMIHARALDSEVGAAKARAILDWLATGVKRTDVVIGPNTYTVWSFTRTSGVLPLGQQEKNRRWLHSLNGTVTIERKV